MADNLAADRYWIVSSRPLRSALRPLRRGLRKLGYDIVPTRSAWPSDFSETDIALYRRVSERTMTSPEAVVTLASAVRHVVDRRIPGAIVECGVWRGGSMMAVASTLLDAGRSDIDLYLFDTFDGMTAPTERDVNIRTGEAASSLLAADRDREKSLLWARAELDDVATAVASVGYPGERTHLVQGKVEATLPERAPEQVALLRLDTDWYESTRHELEHLYPRVASGGVLLIDDYGHWDGCRKAVDEYFAGDEAAPLLSRVDYSGRVGVKR